MIDDVVTQMQEDRSQNISCTRIQRIAVSIAADLDSRQVFALRFLVRDGFQDELRWKIFVDRLRIVLLTRKITVFELLQIQLFSTNINSYKFTALFSSNGLVWLYCNFHYFFCFSL